MGTPEPLIVETPKRLSPIFQLAVALAAIGLVLSVIAHVSAILGRPQPLGGWTMLLHVGIFAVLIPTTLACRGLPSDVEPKLRAQAFFKASPIWARALTVLLFAYAFLNFGLCKSNGLLNKGKSPLGEEPPPMVVRAFSGHWMLFYGMAFVTLLSVPHVAAVGKKPVDDFEDFG